MSHEPGHEPEHDARLAQLAEDVHAARAARGWSQNEFARRAKVNPSILARLLRGSITAGPTERKVRAYLRRSRRAELAPAGDRSLA